MQEDISAMMQLGITLMMTAALFTAVFGVSLQCIDFLDNYQRKITNLATSSAIGDINNLARNKKTFASIYKVVETYPDYVNSLIVDFTDIPDDEYSGEDYVCYRLITTELVDNNLTEYALTQISHDGGTLSDAGFVNIDNLAHEDSIYGTSDNLVSIGHGSGYIRFQCTVYRCSDGQTFDIYARCSKGLY